LHPPTAEPLCAVRASGALEEGDDTRCKGRGNVR